MGHFENGWKIASAQDTWISPDLTIAGTLLHGCSEEPERYRIADYQAARRQKDAIQEIPA